jgi:hypothetical protein
MEFVGSKTFSFKSTCLKKQGLEDSELIADKFNFDGYDYDCSNAGSHYSENFEAFT